VETLWVEALLLMDVLDLLFVLANVFVEIRLLGEARCAFFAGKHGIFHGAGEWVLTSVDTQMVVEVVELPENFSTISVVT